ncbi:MAG: pyrroline-5-carboxylate reductase [Pseudomonadota bacterium]
MINKKIGFIGAGNMAYSLIGGLISSGGNSNLIWVSDHNSNKRDSVATNFSINSCSDNQTLAATVDIIILAVKPQVLQQVCVQIATSITANQPLIISIAAGINSDSIASWLSKAEIPLAIVRCMPNTPALVQSGATALYAVEQVSAQQKTSAESIMRSVGITVWLEQEQQMDAVTAISGSGPAYYFQIIEIMEKSAIAMGLNKEVAHLLAVQTAFGAAKMVLESEDSPEVLRNKVTSPGGTTEKALQIMAQEGLEELLIKATKGAELRSKELSTMLGSAS